MSRAADLITTSLAPAIWGSTYIVTTEYLPDGYPVTAAMLRALPAGVILLLIVRRFPERSWWLKVTVLGALNFSIFWALLFVAAYRLPGGVAATVGAVQPLIVIFLAHAVLKTSIQAIAVFAAFSGVGGVALLVLTAGAALDPLGVAAGFGGAASMAAGTVLSKKWQHDATPLTFTAWQLTAGGLLLLPLATWIEPPLPELNASNALGFLYLGLIGAALTYFLWFRGVRRIEPSTVSALGFLSPATALLLGWGVLGQDLSSAQLLGLAIILTSIWIIQDAGRSARPVNSST